MTPSEKFQQLLRELFQFDSADLDFGIYRIMNFKRDAIEDFVQKDLCEAVAQELSMGILASQGQVATELNEVANQISETLGAKALNGDGQLNEAFRETPLGQRYLDLQSRGAGARTRESLEAAVFNHLYAFFSRYYDDGDFLSKRRYSRREKYAIPYNGEEVHLHWANADQYYIKTTEQFTDYRFKTGKGISVHFKLQAASVEKDNVKGDKRFFLPGREGTTFDPKAGEVLVAFEYRPLTEAEDIKYGKRNQQEAIIAGAIGDIPARCEKHPQAQAALLDTHHRTADRESVSFLEHHLRRYARRNTSDYFIHKDLKGFLNRELDFYLKNEVLNLEELEAGGETRAEGWFQMLRVIRGVGMRIIEFLAQMEEFQKKLFEKKKFVTETQYCITVGNIEEAFYGEIASNEPQWAEWRELFAIDEDAKGQLVFGKNQEERRAAIIKAHPTLVLDTKHFAPGFVDRLLGSFEDLDDMTDGVIVHGENLQTLNLLLEKYRERVQCIYIDPPYNTGNDDFIYKDAYQHSSWLTMLGDRIGASRAFLANQGNLLVSCDDGEEHRLRLMLDSMFVSPGFMANLVWKSRQNVDSRPKNNISNDHEFVLAYGVALRGAAKDETKYCNPDDDKRGPWMSDNMVGLATRRARPNLHYLLLVGKPTRFVEEKDHYLVTICDVSIAVPKELVVGPEIAEERTICLCMSIELDEAKAACIVPRPLDERVVLPALYACPGKGWRYDPLSMADKIVANRILWPASESGRPRKKTYLNELQSSFTGFSSVVGFTRDGTADLAAVFGAEAGISFPKPTSLLQKLVAQGSGPHDLVLDYFAGSGSTGQAVIELNRVELARRRFILVEVADYADTVLIPRIKRVTFSPEWKDGLPARMPNPKEVLHSPRVVKYLRLESYEDSLDNIAFHVEGDDLFSRFDDYVLRYMLDWEAKDSPTLLNVRELASPFEYCLTLTDGQETRTKGVDLPETFNFLLGLHVMQRQVLFDDDRRYLLVRGKLDHKTVVVIWRKTKDWKKEDFERDKAFVAERELTENADHIFVNGDSVIAGARSLDPVFKSRMFGGE